MFRYPSPRVCAIISAIILTALSATEITAWIAGQCSPIPQRIYMLLLALSVLTGVSALAVGPVLAALRLGRQTRGRD